MRTSRRIAPVVGALLCAAGLAACGGSSHHATAPTTTVPPRPSSTPAGTLADVVRAWDGRDWAAMATYVLSPPAGFTATNAAVLTDMGARAVQVTPGVLTVHPGTPHRGTLAARAATAAAPITERYTVPAVGVVTVRSHLDLRQSSGRWYITWSTRTVIPSLGAKDQILVTHVFAHRAGITGADGAPLVTTGTRIQVGVVGQRLKDPSAVRALLIAGGATGAEVTAAFAEAKAHKTYFVPVYEISQADYDDHVRNSRLYAISGTQFEPIATSSAATSGLAAYLVGTIGPVTAQQLHQLGPDYSAGNLVGQSGLEAQYERRLAGTPGERIVVADPAGATLATLASTRAQPGRPVATSISVATQQAAEVAIDATTTPSALVAVQASTGKLLAVATHDPTGDGVDYALDALEAPGSTFKTVTSTALIEDKGLTPASPATCPATRTVDGEVFHNDEGEASGSIDLLTAFAQSCNTAFIGLATSNLTSAQLVAAARSYRIGTTPEMGYPAYGGSVPTPTDEADLASTSIGQGQITVSPLDMAMVAAAIDSGVVRAPRLVVGAPDDTVPGRPLDPQVKTDLTTMMAAVVASGTAAGTGLPAGTYAKTGTAEFGDASPPQTHAWLIGFRGDVAFAVWVQVGVSGAKVAAPLAANFLDAIGG